MKYPNFIKENDCIGVPAPSGGAGTTVSTPYYAGTYKFTLSSMSATGSYSRLLSRFSGVKSGTNWCKIDPSEIVMTSVGNSKTFKVKPSENKKNVKENF